MKAIEVHSFKWPRRPTSVTTCQFLGEDRFGHWIGAARGQPWHSADFSRSGVMLEALVKLVPPDTLWTACFQPVDPVVDVDIVLPVHWAGDVLEEVDLELDILRYADGRVIVRDQEKFDHVRATYAMPEEIAAKALATCAQIRAQVAQGDEPFGSIGQRWLSRFLDEVNRGSER